MARTVVIHSRAGAGFRRGGIAHPQGRAEYPLDAFTGEQLQAIHDEPLLDAEIVGEDDPAPEKTDEADPKKAAKGK